MNTKAKLAFEMLEQEIEVLNNAEMQSNVGGMDIMGGVVFSMELTNMGIMWYLMMVEQLGVI